VESKGGGAAGVEYIAALTSCYRRGCCLSVRGDFPSGSRLCIERAPGPVVTDEAAYSQTLKIVASALTRARDVDDVYSSRAQQWLVKALRLRGGFDNDQRVREAILRGVLEDALTYATATYIAAYLPDLRVRFSRDTAEELEARLRERLSKNLANIAERFPIVR
jgi:hypothetical protein